MDKIRKATLKDLLRMNEIYIEGCVDEGKFQFPRVSRKEMLRNLKKGKKRRLNAWRKNLKSKKCYYIVAEEKGKIKGLGFAQSEIKDEGMIENVYVDKRYRKRGIGKKIILELTDWLKKKKVKYIEIDVYFKNKPAIRLYKKLGFKPLSMIMRLKRK